MIKGLAGGAYISVTGQAPIAHINTTMPSAGMVRYNGVMFSLEVYDGMSWQTLTNSYPTVDLFPDAAAAVEWAKKKMQEEQELQKYIDEYPAVKDLNDKLQMVLTLIKTNKNESS